MQQRDRQALRRSRAAISAAQGSGIDPDDLPTLFQPFSCLTPPSTEYIRRSGLGLYSCRRIEDVPGGRIWIDREPGEETTAAFSLPSIEESG